MSELEEREGMAAELARLDARCRSNSRRIEELEGSQRAVTELALSVRAMATEQSNMKDDLGEVKSDVKLLTQKAGRRWDGLMEKLIWLVIGGAAAEILSRSGLI